jgi:hypothetical protein
MTRDELRTLWDASERAAQRYNALCMNQEPAGADERFERAIALENARREMGQTSVAFADALEKFGR